MKTVTTNLRASAASFGAFAAAPMYPGAPRIMFDAPNDQGTKETKTADELAAEQAAADAAAKAAEEETARLAAEEAAKTKNKTDDDTGKGEDKGLLAEVMAKKTKIKDLETQLSRFDGIDPDAVRALLEEKRSNELAAEEAKGNFERVKEMMAEQHTKDKKSLEDQVAALTAQLADRDETINELTVGRSFSESKFISDDLVLTRSKTRQLYAAHFDAEAGVAIGYDKPKGAKDRTILVDAAGKPLSFDEALRAIVEADPDKDELLRDKAKVGAGSQTKKVDPPAEGKNKDLYGVSRIAAGLAAMGK